MIGRLPARRDPIREPKQRRHSNYWAVRGGSSRAEFACIVFACSRTRSVISLQIARRCAHAHNSQPTTSNPPDTDPALRAANPISSTAVGEPLLAAIATLPATQSARRTFAGNNCQQIASKRFAIASKPPLLPAKCQQNYRNQKSRPTVARPCPGTSAPQPRGGGASTGEQMRVRSGARG